MPWTYDHSADALYVYFGDCREHRSDHQVDVAEGIVIDIGADGQALGVEILHPANAPWELVLRHDLVPLAVVRQLADLSAQRWRPINFVTLPMPDNDRDGLDRLRELGKRAQSANSA